MFDWDIAAERRVLDTLGQATLDRASGRVVINSNDLSTVGQASREFRGINELRTFLLDVGNEVMARYGVDKPPCYGISQAVVEAAMWAAGIPELFRSFGRPGDEHWFLSLEDLTAAGQDRVIRVSMEEVNARLIEYFADHPDALNDLDPRRLEEVVATLFDRMGFESTLTPPSKDGGRDILAVKRSDVGTLLTLVECKKYRPDRKVGVSLVRALYGVLEEERASHGVIVTTSAFTRGAEEFQKKLQWRLSLKAYDDLRMWCAKYRTPR